MSSPRAPKNQRPEHPARDVAPGGAAGAASGSDAEPPTGVASPVPVGPEPPRPLHSPSGIGVVDKSVMILDALEAGPASLAQLVECTGLARPTVHRLASALIHHRFLSRDVRGRYVIGSRLAELASARGTTG